ncbi:hypothetical protein AB9F45_39895, partial [Rhizobium leguminosarum]|uniref:hypothetical protein n=1 Tax=Rhizobium leguminosarum TaxID=384 RepID=UPI003F9AA9C6
LLRSAYDGAHISVDLLYLLGQARPAFVAWLGAINKFIDYQEELNKSIGGEVRRTASGFKQLALTALGIAAVLSLVAA